MRETKRWEVTERQEVRGVRGGAYCQTGSERCEEWGILTDRN